MQSQAQADEVSLQEILNPKSKISAPSTIAHVLWMKRYIILALWLVLGVPLAAFLAVYDIPKAYWTSTSLRFPNVVGAEHNMVRDISIAELESVISLFKSHNVMSKTINTLSLQFQITTKNVFRRDVFEDIRYGGEARPGHYTIALKDSELEILFRPAGVKDEKRLFRGAVPRDRTVNFGGITARFAPSVLASGDFEVEANFIPLEDLILAYRKKLGVRALEGGARVKVNYTIFFEDRDPHLVADILNDLVRNFITVFTGTTEVQDVNVLDQMEKNLELAREKEKKAQEMLAQFYAKHPYLVQTQQNDAFALVSAQSEKARLTDRIDDLRQLSARAPAPGTADQRRLWLAEALNLLNSQEAVQAVALQTQVEQLAEKRIALTRDYSAGHPLVMALVEEEGALFSEAQKLVSAHRAGLEKRMERITAEITRNLPRTVPVAADLEARRLNAEKENASRVVENLQMAYDRAKLSMGRDFFKVTVVDPARPPEYGPPSLIRRLAFSAAALIFGLLPGLFFFVGKQVLGGSIWNRDDAERKLRVKVAGSLFYVPSAEGRSTTQRNRVEDRLIHKGEASSLQLIENYRSIRAEVENIYPVPPDGHLGLLVTSTQPFEGKSLVCANLAVSFARKKRRTLLIDADFRHGRQDQIFEMRDSMGLADILDEFGLNDHGRKDLVFGAIMPTHEQGLFLLPKGKRLETGAESITQSKVNAIITLLQSNFDVIIIDTPPVIVAADAFNLMKIVPNVLFVVRSGAVLASDAEEALNLVKDRNVNLSCVVNAVEESPFVKNRYTKYGYYYTP